MAVPLAAAPRIACLVPSVTELLAALGLTPWLVARTGYCTHPAELLAPATKVGGTKDVNLAKLRRLAPTHAIVNVDENRAEMARALHAFVPQVIVTHPCGPEDVAALIDQVCAPFAAIEGVAARAAVIQGELRAELDATQALAPRHVLYLIWREPWMTVARDTYISRLLARVGWLTLPDTTGGASGAGRYPAFDDRQPWLAEVQEVLLSSEPYAFTHDHLALTRALCPHARVRLVDGQRLSWYGSRTAAGLRYLRDLAST
jgi:ABC-type Fe3+-hydroxamate transport system substrate-binding protein